MMLRPTHCGFLLAIVMACGLAGVPALAQTSGAEPPTTQPAAEDERSEEQRAREALERLKRLRQEMKDEPAAKPETKPAPEVQPDAETPDATKDQPQPERRSRRPSVAELRARAKASTRPGVERPGEEAPDVPERPTRRNVPERRPVPPSRQPERPSPADDVPADLIGPPQHLATAQAEKDTEPAPPTRRTRTAPEGRRVVEPEPEEPEPELVRRESDPDKIWFQFDGIPWSDVVMYFVERLGKPLMTPEEELMLLTGELTYITNREFTKDEALDELNLIMHEIGYRFVEQEHHIRIIPLSEMRQWVPINQTYPTIAEFQQDDPRDMDFVIVYYRVEDYPAQQFVEMFNPSLPDYALMEALDTSNQIKIIALAQDVRKFMSLTELVDLSPSDPREMRIFDIKTNAADIEQRVRAFLNMPTGQVRTRLKRDPRTGRMVRERVGGGGAESDVQMVADDRTNSIIVKATKDQMEEIAELIDKFDQKPEIGTFDTRVVKVQHADASEVANLLNQIFQQEQGQARSPNWQLQRRLQAARARAAARRGRNRNTRRTTPQQRSAQSGTVAPEEILAEGIFERAKKTIRLVAEPRQNLLFVYANEEGHQRVSEMLATIDQPLPEKYKTVAVEHANVNEIAPMVTELAQGLTEGTRGTMRIVGDASKSLFHVFAERDTMDKIEMLITRLDVPGPEKHRHVVELENKAPSEIAGVIEKLLEEDVGSTPRRSISRRGRFNRRRAGPMQPSVTSSETYQLIPLDDAGILIVICTDEDWAKIEGTIQLWDSRATTNTPKLETFAIQNGNAESIASTLSSFYRSYQHPIYGRSPVAIQPEGETVYVYAIQPALEEIGALIESLDVERTEDKVEILPLTYASATDVAQQLQQLFGQSRRGRRGRGATGPQIQAEPVTNSLIVQANKSDLEEIMGFAQQMDEKVAAQEPEQKFYTLRYAQPREVAQAVQQMFGGGGGRRRGQSVGQQIKAVASGPQVIVEAPADKLKEIDSFIAQLDDPKGQEIVIKTITLPGADVGQIARKLQTSFRQKKNVTAIFDADASSETIVVTANKDALEEALSLIKELAEAQKGLVSTVEFVQLERAPANEASNWLRDQLITYIQKQYGRGAASQVKVTYQTSTNRVIINGPQVAVEHGKTLLSEYDADIESGFEPTVQTQKFELPGLDVRSLARALDRTFREEARQRPDRRSASFEADELTQTLIVSAPQDMFGRIQEIIQDYERDAEEFEPEPVFIDITEADANYVRGQLQQMLPPMLSKQYGRRAAQEVQITADTRLNRLWITAPKFAIDVAKNLVAELDKPPIGEDQLRTITLDNADASTVNNILRNIFSEKIRAKSLQVSVDPLTNSLIVGGNDEDFAQIEKWATDLDEQAVAKQGKLEILDILNANPWEIRNILNAQYGGGGWGRRRKLGQEYSFDVVGGRYLVVQAPEDKMAEIKDLVQRLDDSDVDKVEVRIYELPGIGRDIRSLAREVTRAMNQTIEQRERRVNITAYEEADTLIVTARTEQFTEIETFIEKFKGLVEKETTVTKFVELEHLDAGQYARTIQDMLANKLAKEGQRSSRYMHNLSITPDTRTNRLICYVPEKIVPDLEEVINFLDVEPTINQGEIRMIELAHADANSVAQSLRAMFEERNRRRSRNDFSQIEVRIQPEPITNSLMVTAEDEDFEQIKQQAIMIDEKSLVQGNEPQVIDLEYANPNEVANLVNQWFGGRSGRRGTNQASQAKASVVNGVLVVAAPKKDLAEISTLIDELDQPDPSGVTVKTYDLKVLNATQVMAAVQMFLRDLSRNTRPGQLKPGAYAEPTTNTLVVLAPPEVMPMIDALVSELEGKVTQQSLIRSYVLRNARADQIASNLDAMLKAKVQEREGRRSSIIQTTVTADPSSNRLFVYAPEEYQELATQLVEMVDEQVDTGEIVHIIPIETGNAQEIARSLSEVSGSSGRGRRGTGGPRVRIVADTSSNSILLGGLPKDVAEVESWLSELQDKGMGVPELQIFQLRYASSDAVVDTLRTIFPSSRNAQDNVTITTDEYSGRLFVTANRRKMRLVEQYVNQLDAEPEGEEMGLLACGHELHFVDINRGSASDIAWDVRDLMPDSDDRCAPTVEADWFGEYIRVTCRPGEFDQILSLIREFERRAKPELVVRTIDPKGDTDALLEYLRARRGDDFVVQDQTTAVPKDTLVEELWPEGTEPPQIREKNESQREPRRSRGQGRSQAEERKPLGAGLSLNGGLLDSVEADVLGAGGGHALAARARRAKDQRESPFRLASFTAEAAADEAAADESVTNDKQPAPTKKPTLPVPRMHVVSSDKDAAPPADAGGSDQGVGKSVPSPVEKQRVRIVRQPDGTLLIEGPRDDVDEITDAIDTITEDLAVGEVIRIFKFKYGDVTAAAEVLSIMFDVQPRRQVVIQQPQRGRQQQGQGRGDDREQQGGIMGQFQRMVGGRDRGRTDRGPNLRIATDPGHNYLIIKCDEVYLPEIRQLLRELDIPPGEVQVEIIQLRNLQAEEAAQDIKDWLGISKVQERRGGSSRRRTPSRGRRGSSQQQLMEMLQQTAVSVPGVEGGAKVEQVEIIPNATTNSLLVSAPPEVMGLIKSKVSELEGIDVPDVVGIHHYALQHARVDDVLPLLREIFESTGGAGGSRRGQGAGSPAAMGPVTVSADPRVNTIIFTAQSKDVDKVRQQIESLDIEGAVAEAEMYICQWGDAAAIAEVVDALYGSGGGGGRRGRGGAPESTTEVRIVAEAATNTILVWGPPDKRDLIFDKIESLDQLNERDIREIPIQFADAEELAATLSEIFATGAQQTSGRRGRGRGGRGGPSVTNTGRIMIMGDKNAKKLLVRAPEEIYQQILTLVRTLDQPSQKMQLRRFALQHADAEAVVESVKAGLTEYMQLAKANDEDADLDAFTALPDPRTNSITVVGSEETFLFVEQVLSAVDVPTPDDQRKEFRIFPLERADATVVAEAINSFATGGTEGGGRRGRRGGPTGGAREINVHAMADEATNSVMVFGRADDINLIQTSVIDNYEDQMDERIQIASVPVQNVTPSQIVGFIYQFLDANALQTSGGRGGRGGRRGQRGAGEQAGPQIVPNDNGKALIVRGTSRQIDEVRELVNRFDDPNIVMNQTKVISVPVGQDAARLASEIERLINESEETFSELYGRPPRQIVVGADEYSNTILLAGEPTMFGMAESLVEQLAEARPDDYVTRVIEFRKLSADAAVETIQNLQEQTPGGSRGGTRRAPSRRGGSRRGGRGGRGALEPHQLPYQQVQPYGGPVAWFQPCLTTAPLTPFIAAAAFNAAAEDDPNQPPPRARRAFRRDEIERELGADEPRQEGSDTRPARRTAPPAQQPAAQPRSVTDTLTGVSGALRGEVTARTLDSQRIIITGDERDVEFIEQILLMMELEASPAVIQVFTLENAKATALAPIIETAMQEKINVRTATPGPQDRFSISAEARSNSLIVAASARVMDQIAELIETLDVEQTMSQVAAQTVPLRYMRAVEAVAILKPIIEQINDQREVPKESQVSISAIDRSNSVMIVGTPKDVEEVQGIVTEIDVELTEDAEDMSFLVADAILIQLKNGDAEQVAEVLNELIEEQQELARNADPEKPGEPFVKVLKIRLPDGRELPPLNLDRPIKIIPEQGTNSLIVFSTQENNEALQEIVGVFDTLPIGAETDVKAFTLKHAAAEEVASLIEEVFENKSYLNRPVEGDSSGPSQGVLPPVPPGVAAKGLPYPIVVQADARTNTIIVVGRTDAVILAGGLISELDRPLMDLGLRPYVLNLKRTSATEMSEKLEELLEQQAQARGGDNNEARDSAVIAPDERTNSLIIFATEEMYDMIEDLALQLDTAEKYGTVAFRRRPLKHSDAVKLQAIVEEVFTAKEDAEKQVNSEMTDTLSVLADTRSNALLLTGTRDYLDEAESIIDALDQAGDGTVVVRATKVRLNSAANVASLLQEMIDEALESQDSKLKGTPIHLSADPITDTLLIAAAEEDMVLIERWVEILDRPSEIGRMTLVVPLGRARAEDVAQTVESVFSRSGGQQGGEIEVTITSDETTNSLVAFGPPAIIQDIEHFVQRLDSVEPQGGAIVRMFKLEKADAEDAGELLTRILEMEGGSVGGTGGGGGGAAEADNRVMLFFQRQHPELGMETLRALRKDITVLADIRTNSLVVTAPPESMPLMESLVEAIDTPPDAARVRVFALRNADAEQMVELLQELFERETQSTGGGTDESTRELTVTGLNAMGGRQEIAFTTDVRTNSVIAAGTPGYLDLVEEMILNLDTVPIKDRETFVYAPKNNTADAIAQSLREFSEAEQQRLQEIGDEVSTQVRQAREIVVIPNEEANRVLIDVDPRFKDTVMQVVSGLDEAPPQVVIQVLILEVTMDNELDLGVEFAFQDLQYSKAGPTDTTTFDYIGGTDLGAAGSGLGGFTFTITGADFNFLFRTLQNEGNLKVLSRPQITAMDNQEAMIDISDDVPYVSGTQTSSTGQISTSVSRANIGIVLEVTPQINPDGFVRMEISQEVSDRTGSTVDVGPGVTSPVFFQRRAETTIMVKDNETVVLGGLITSRVENREQKVPILGDIPGLGTLFRNQNDTSRRTELLLVLTPHVIRTVDDYRDISVAERDRLRLLSEDYVQDPLIEDLRLIGGPAVEPDYPPAPASEPNPEAETAEELVPDDEVYGPMRPAQRRAKPGPAFDPESYDVPVGLLSDARHRRGS